MISSLLALTLATAVQQDVTVTPRRQFTSCLNRFVRQSVETNASPETFATGFAVACAREEAALRDAIIQRGTRAGDPRSRAENDARDEIGLAKDGAREMFELERSAPQT